MLQCFEFDQSASRGFGNLMMTLKRRFRSIFWYSPKMKNTPTSVSKKPQFEFRKLKQKKIKFMFYILVSHEDIEKLYHHYTLLDPKATTNGVSVSHLLSLPGAKENPLAKRIMECFDENGDGSVDFEEFVNGLAVFSSRGRKLDKIKCKLKAAYEIFIFFSSSFLLL